MRETNNLLIVLTGFMILKARITVIVFAKTVEIANVNTSANVICCSMQETVFGHPMKKKEQKKQRRMEMSRI